jgi:DNA-directed RNA polymerase sigma subunit (sigma70/sigma32)
MGRRKRLFLFSDLSKREVHRMLPLTSEDEDPSALADQTLLAEAVTRALQELSPRLRAVLALRYGLLGSECHSLDELHLLGCYRREYLSACQHAALRRLRNVLLRSRTRATGDLWKEDGAALD